MIYFNIATTYQLTVAMTYKEKYFSNQKAVLFITTPRLLSLKNPKKLYDIFEYVIDYKTGYDFYTNGNPKLDFYDIESQLKEHNLKITSNDQIFAASTHFKFGLYLLNKKIKFNFMEEAAGMLFHPHVLEDIDKKISLQRFKYAKTNGLYDGTNRLVLKRICNPIYKNKIEGKNIEYFDVVKELYSLSLEQKNKIVSIFVDKIEKIDPKSIIFFTQHFANLQIHSFNNHCLIYQLVVDYFFEKEKILFKKHPDDVMIYKHLFPQFEIIENNFPSELIPYVYEEAPKGIATICSTAINTLKTQYDERFLFSLDFAFGHTLFFQKIHKYFIALLMFNSNVNKKIYIHNGLENLVHNFIKTYSLNYIITNEQSTANIIIIDNYNDEDTTLKISFDTDKIYIFINNIDELYNECDTDIINQTLILEISKTIINNQKRTFQNLENEYIYIYNTNTLKNDINLEKNLHNTNVIITTKQLNSTSHVKHHLLVFKRYLHNLLMDIINLKLIVKFEIKLLDNIQWYLVENSNIFSTREIIEIQKEIGIIKSIIKRLNYYRDYYDE